jgi:hypothetical protein
MIRRAMAHDTSEGTRMLIHGLHSYDLHVNHDYRRRFGLDCAVPDCFHRGLPGHEINPSTIN